MPSSSGVPHVFQGVIDLAFRTPGDWTLLDYRNRPRPVARSVTVRREDRRRQEHWASLARTPVARASLYSVWAREFIAAPLGPSSPPGKG
jgi:hypothetical protein